MSKGKLTVKKVIAYIIWWVPLGICVTAASAVLYLFILRIISIINNDEFPWNEYKETLQGLFFLKVDLHMKDN